MTNELASIASAISASCSAIAAITIMLIQRKNMVDSAGPEIVLEGWERKRKTINTKEYDVLSFTKVVNVGKGSALHVAIKETLNNPQCHSEQSEESLTINTIDFSLCSK